MGRPGKSRVEPPIEILTKHFLRDVTDIEKDVHPLAALGFMAGQSAAMVHEIQPCADIIKSYFDGTEAVIETITSKLK